MKKLAIFLAIFLLALSSQASGRQDTIVIGLGEEPDCLNPMISHFPSADFAGNFLFSYFVRYSPDGSLIPDLITEIPTLENGGISPDGLTCTYHLRTNAVWHDGTPLTSADIRFTYNLIVHSGFYAASRHGWDKIEGILTPSETTVIFKLREPYSLFVSEIFSEEPVLPAHLLQGATEDFESLPYQKYPVGSGPYILEEWKQGKHVVLTVNPDYFRSPPDVKTIVLKFIPDEQARQYLLEKGEIDAVDARALSRIKAGSAIEELENPGSYGKAGHAPAVPGAAGEKGDRAWTIVATYQIPNSSSGLAWDGTYLYSGIYGSNGDQIYQIDPSDGSYSLAFTGPQGDAFGLTYDGTYLWTTDHPSTPAVAIQMDWTGGQLSSFNLPDRYMSGIAYDGGDFWVATYYPDPSTIYKVNSSGGTITSFTAPDNQPWDLCMENGYLWMADYWGDTLYRIDPSDGSVDDSHASEYVDPAGIVYDGTYLWYCDEGTGGFDNLYKVDLSGAGTPAISVPDTDNDYGPVTIGDTETWYVTVYSTGTADLVIDDITFTDPDLSCTWTFPLTITTGNYEDIPIDYAPDAIAALDATGTIASNDPISPEVYLTLTGHGVSSGPDINLPETSHNYGTIRLYASKQWLMEVQNMGDETLTISDLALDDSHFYVDSLFSLPADIGVLGTTDVGIWFNPKSATSYNATLTITSNDTDESPYYVTLDGAGSDTAQPIGNSLWNYTITTSYDNSPKAIAPINDVSGDGIPDVIVCSEDDYIRCFNGASDGTADILWEHEIYAGSVYHQNDLTISADIDDDGYEEVVVGSAWGGRLIRMISGRTGQTIWTHDTHEYGDGGWVYQVDCSYDYNGDGLLDVLASTGDDSNDTGPKRVYCLNAVNGLSIWECSLGGPGFSVIGVEDFTGDGQPDVVAGASNESETVGKVYPIDGASGTIYCTYNTTGSSVWALAQITDITGDKIEDVMAGDFSGYLYGIDPTDCSQEYSPVPGISALVLRFETMDDVNSDDFEDILIGHSGLAARMFDPYAGSFIWTQALVDKSWTVDRIPDINADGINDAVVGTLFSNNYYYVLDGVSGSEVHSANVGSPVDAISATPDIVGDGSWEIVPGLRNGYVACYSGGTAVAPNDPPSVPDIQGPTWGRIDQVYRFAFMAADPEENNLYYYIDWGDGNESGWIGPYRTGEWTNVWHQWTGAGVFQIRAKSKDPFDQESSWSAPQSINILDTLIVPTWLEERGEIPDSPSIAGQEGMQPEQP